MELDPTSSNSAYFAKLQEALNAIHAVWPDISSLDALPLVGDSGHLGLTGFVAPFDPVVYTTMRAASENYMGKAGINFFWHNVLQSMTPYVPIYLDRVLELAAAIVPGQSYVSVWLRIASR